MSLLLFPIRLRPPLSTLPRRRRHRRPAWLSQPTQVCARRALMRLVRPSLTLINKALVFKKHGAAAFSEKWLAKHKRGGGGGGAGGADGAAVTAPPPASA